MNKFLITSFAISIGTTASAQTQITAMSLYPTPVKAERAVPFNFSAQGKSLPIEWGFDTAWNDYANMLRGIRFAGSDIIDVARVSFNPWAEITQKGVLPPLLQEQLDKRLETVSLIGHPVNIALNLDAGEPTIKELYGGLDENNNYIGNPEEVAHNYAMLIDATVTAVNATKHKVVSAAPFNEPDYFWNGTPINVFDKINKRLKNIDEFPQFADIRLSGGNTLNCDEALPWYTELKDYLDEGNTHQLAGDFDHYADFFATVRADGKHATADELHNVMEAMVGVEYGMQTGIWWGTAEQARGEFCKASFGKRLAYAENRDAWSAAAVYRAPSGKIQGFAGCSERQAKPSAYRYVSLDGDMYVDGQGPLREYILELPGDPNGAYQTELQRNAETVINITRGTDVAQDINGSYTIVNSASHLVIGPKDASTANLQPLEQQAYTMGNHQHWTIQSVPNTQGGDYSYYFITNTSDGQAMDNLNWNLQTSGPVICYGLSRAAVQQWALEYDGNGLYHIRNKYSALYLEAADTAEGTPVLQQERTDSPNQQWRLIPASVPLDFEAPAAPKSLTATTVAATARLSWEPVADADSYNILRAISGTDDYNTIARGLTSTEYIDNTVISDNTYDYRIVAVDAALNRSISSEKATVSPSLHGLVAAYSFDGTLDDSTDNLYHARALVKEPEYSTKDGVQRLRFRADRIVQLPYSTMEHGPEITIALHARRSSSVDGLYIFSTGYSEDETMNISLFQDGLLKLTTRTDGGESEISTTAPTMTEWMHVIATIDTSTGETVLYINGQPTATSADFGLYVPKYRPITYVGAGQDHSKSLFNGMIRDLRIYNRVLSAAEAACIATESASVIDTAADAQIVSRSYHDTRGISISNPDTYKGILIITNTLSNGSIKMEKIIK